MIVGTHQKLTNLTWREYGKTGLIRGQKYFAKYFVRRRVKICYHFPNVLQALKFFRGGIEIDRRYNGNYPVDVVRPLVVGFPYQIEAEP